MSCCKALTLTEGLKKDPDVNAPRPDSSKLPLQRSVTCRSQASSWMVDAAAGVSFSGWRLEAPEREVDARPDRARCLGNRVRVVTLRLSSHDEEVALAKIPAPPLATRPMS